MNMQPQKAPIAKNGKGGIEVSLTNTPELRAQNKTAVITNRYPLFIQENEEVTYILG